MSLATPFVMRAETEGKYLWFTAIVGNAIGRIEMSTGKVTAFPIPTPLSFPVETTADSEGNIWYTHLLMNTIGRLDPKTGSVTEFDFPNAILPQDPVGILPTISVGIFYGPGDNIWFAEGLDNVVGKYALS